MKKFCLRVALLMITAVGIAAAKTGRSTAGRSASGSSAAALPFDAANLVHRDLWTQVNATPYKISSVVSWLCAGPRADVLTGERKRNPHADTYIIVYVNPVGREAMFSKTVHTFPEGSVIVKQKFDRDVLNPEPLLYTVMRKRFPGYNPKAGDWEFSVVSGGGKTLEAAGKLQNCISCHEAKRDSDFVFRSYVGHHAAQ